MRVGIQSGGVISWLAGQAGVSERVHSSARDFALSRERQQTVSPIVKGTITRQFDRGNESSVVTFSTTRKFDSSDECFLYLIDYNLPLVGVVVFEIEVPGGGVIRRLMANAVMSKPEMDPIGETLTLYYSITGGNISENLGHYINGDGGDYLTGTGDLYLTGI